jgi:hypothetical protein
MGMNDDKGVTSPQTSPLLDWYTDFTHLRDATLRVGQSKVPFNRQRVASSGDQQFVDRSIVNGAFNIDRDIGVDLRSKDFLGLGLLKYYAGVWIGEGRNTSLTSDFGMMAIARVEVLPLGIFKDDYKEADLSRDTKPRVSVGFAYARIEQAPGTRGILGRAPKDGGTSDVNALSWDVLFKCAGLSVYSEWAWRNADRNPGDQSAVEEPVFIEGDYDGIGGMVQAGYLFDEHFELAARAGQVRGIKTTNLDDEDEYGVAASYYFAGHPMKLQTDFFRLGEQAPGEPSMTFDSVFRLQLQAGF